MKNILKNIGKLALLLAMVSSCQDDDKTFGSLDAPKNIELTYEIVGKDAEHPDGDGSGKVILKATADNAVSFKYLFSDGTSQNAPGGVYTKTFTRNGVNTYTVNVVAFGKGGTASNTSFEVTVFSNFSDPEAITLLTNGSSKKWYWAAAVPGHLGVGQNDGDITKNFYPNYYAAAPFEKAGSPDSSCLYDNELRFFVENGVLKYELNNGGKTFFNAAFLGVGGGSGGSDLCLNYNTSGVKTVALSPSESLVPADKKRGTSMTFSDNGFMGYYIGQSTYEIMELTDSKLVVRAVMGGNPALAWYHTFSNQPPVQGGGNDPDYTNMVWSDEFNVDGAPDPTKWSYNLGAGGWGNSELQHYTDRLDNAVVQGGVLKIIAKAENFSGSNYTSARLVTENKFEFKYGKVEVRAKLPSGGGTWPAIWALGENYATNIWPACGEIDIMEHKGNSPNTIHGTLHYPGRSGGNADTGTTTASNVSSEFHIYKVIWSPTSIKFYIDDQPAYHSFVNSASTPFNSDFFLILNVAMGGTFGGTVDPAFTQSAMEVDYVRVYQ
ncbi:MULTISPECIES: glycoside hydrolase family 16 protein [Flavobacterium]|jgi:beta-glucanase (GH16 family)|uniref:Beta-glucanase (GH16 family) n=1 Tax=Flavobacterium lindanitolerans TaxID=428988 RepID=A0A497V059_9FLAO|nr:MULTISPECIES: glycoside hydrolase family 16 protein [Flavobacterium]MBL7868037.1 family 16 glycosylhydrolase [Flavobacterium lindanitolerans]OJX48905.1 MAG: laminarinase [Flavobacterium sp. 38-13]PKW21058.1 beta-glucanase (GH16 family) [Flavobacterium lindanitolerans]RLJ30303.1 beta-glucanase (GH16 family) [Flavobacterium lindanitolerans]